MPKTQIKKVALVVGVLVVFIGFIQFNQYQSSHFKVDEETFNVKESMPEVMDVYYERYRPLEAADKYKIVNQVNKTIPLPNERRTLKLHKVWLKPNGALVVYSFDLLKNDKNLEAIPRLKVEGIRLHLKNGETVEARLNVVKPPNAKELPNRMTYNYRVYNTLLLRPRDFLFGIRRIQPFNEGGPFYTPLKSVESVTFKGMMAKIGDKKKPLGNIHLNADFNIERYMIGKTTLNRTYQVSPQVKVHFDSLIRYYTHAMLKGDLISDQLNVTQVRVVISGGEEKGSFRLGVGQGNIYLPTSAMLTKSGEVTLVIDEVIYSDRTKGKISFKITKEQIHRLINEGDHKPIKVADIPNGTVYFGYDSEGVASFPGETFFIEFRSHTDNTDTSPQIARRFRLITDHQFEAKLANAPEQRKKQITADSHVVTIGAGGQSFVLRTRNMLQKNSHYFYFETIMHEAKSLDELYIKISSIPYVKDIEDKEIKLQLPTLEQEPS